MQFSFFTNFEVNVMSLSGQGQVPEVYRRFYESCDQQMPDQLRFCEIRNHNPHLQDKAKSIVAAVTPNKIIGEKQFVYLIVNDSSLFYFDLDGTENPLVWFWSERSKEPKKIGTLKIVLAGYV